MTFHWVLSCGRSTFVVIFRFARLGHYRLLVSFFSFLLSFSFSCLCFGPAALSVWFAAAPVRLVVRLWVVGRPFVASRPKLGGPVGWLFALVGLCTFNLLLRWLSRLGACMTVDFVSCCFPALDCSVRWFVSLLFFRCWFSQLVCVLFFQLLFVQCIDVSVCFGLAYFVSWF